MQLMSNRSLYHLPASSDWQSSNDFQPRPVEFCCAADLCALLLIFDTIPSSPQTLLRIRLIRMMCMGEQTVVCRGSETRSCQILIRPRRIRMSRDTAKAVWGGSHFSSVCRSCLALNSAHFLARAVRQPVWSPKTVARHNGKPRLLSLHLSCCHQMPARSNPFAPSRRTGS